LKIWDAALELQASRLSSTYSSNATTASGLWHSWLNAERDILFLNKLDLNPILAEAGAATNRFHL
jgi:hypothetical protein